MRTSQKIEEHLPQKYLFTFQSKGPSLHIQICKGEAQLPAAL